jgi:16S rRNA (uracil1498-N3)-methyltransferase
VVERADRAPVATFHAPGDWGAEVELDEAAAHHAGVKRLAAGDRVRLSSGDGRRASGVIAELAKRRLAVSLDEGSVERIAPPPYVELWAPVGDRERMLWLAEKAAELGVSAWRPLIYRRSRSVTPRGEGEGFRAKLRQRMIGALEQSGGAWLPEMYVETPVEAALRDAGPVAGILLDVNGVPLQSLDGSMQPPMAVALGPEGGLEDDERGSFLSAGWRPASLGPNVLRFETAGIAALALVRSFTR